MEQELHLQPLPTPLSQGQGRRALGVPGVTGHRRPTEEQSLRLCQVTGGDGGTQSLQQSRGASGEADGSTEEETPSKRSRVSAVSCRTPGCLPAASQPPGQNKGGSNWEKKFGAGSESLP